MLWLFCEKGGLVHQSSFLVYGSFLLGVAMSLSSNGLAPSSIVANLYMQALRQGQALWFTVASGSMRPLLAVGDDIYIEPACAHHLCIGDIAAFETPQGLMVHRIVQRRQQKTTIRLLQMADIDLYPGWIAEPDVIGRVVAIRRGATTVNLRHPFARQLGIATAYLRYWLSRCKRHDDPGLVLHLCSRVMVHLQSRCIRWFCTSPLIGDGVWINDEAFEQEKQYVTTE